MLHRHSRLIKYLSDVSAAGALRIDLYPFDLSTKVEPMAGRQLEFHPEVFPKFQDLLIVARSTDSMKTEPLKEWNQYCRRKIVFAGGVKELTQPGSLGGFVGCQWARALWQYCGTGSRTVMADMRFAADIEKRNERVAR